MIPARPSRSCLASQHRWILLRATLICLLLFATGPAIASQAQLPVRETVAHQLSGDYVQFALSERPMTVALQGLAPKSGRWVTLRSRNRPALGSSQFQIPKPWRNAELRVLATHRGASRRSVVPSTYDAQTHAVDFVASEGARLFSIESRSGSGWKRVSTLAAPPEPKALRVALPSSVPDGARVRVVAVSGRGRSFPSLTTPLSSRMRGGPVAFAASLEAISNQPLPTTAVADVVVGTANTDAKSITQAVEESDIWRVHGERIYFFNRLRGLQIINVAEPSAPFEAGRLPMLGVGEEMYIISDPAGTARQAVLLTSGMSPTNGEETQVCLVSLSGDLPAEEAKHPLPGQYVDSRLVGGLLHVITRSGWWSEAATLVTTFAVGANGALTEESSQSLPFAASLVGSTGNYLWVAGETADDWWRQQLAAFPVRLDGSLGECLVTQVGGRVQDKFKVGDTSEGLAVVVQDWSAWPQATFVETYRAEGTALVVDDKLELVRGESLFASRFDGNRLYVVTFEQVDPLWIVDLADPSNLATIGHLEVPGWSFFIQPMGDVLLAVGRDGGAVHVTMFDVANPANMSQVKRIDIGEGWSSTEAEWNEKAVRILPDAGLLLVPVVESLDGKVSRRVALVDFDTESRQLVERGAIEHAFEPRRAALMDHGLIASVSNRELLLVDIADRDRPVVPGRLNLAQGVDRVVVHDGTALLFENGSDYWNSDGRRAVLRTAPAGQPDQTGPEIGLECDRVPAAAVFDGRLFVVESSHKNQGWFRWQPASLGGEGSTDSVSVWSLENAAKPALLGRIPLPFDAGDEVEFLPVEGGRVALVSREQGWGFMVRPMPVVRPMVGDMLAPAMTSIARSAPPMLGWGNQRLDVAIVETQNNAPSLVGAWNLAGGDYTGISRVYSAGDLLVFSFGAREEVKSNSGDALWSGFWSGWSTRHWLQVLDLADPSSPMPWAPVQLPGELLGVSWFQRSGGTLFTRSEGRVAAVGFDGENASVAAEVIAGPVVAVAESTLYFPGPDGVEEWKFSEHKRHWSQSTGWALAGADQQVFRLHLADGALLAGGHSQTLVLGADGTISAFTLPYSADLDGALKTSDGWLVPAGEYGAVRLR